MPWKRRGWPCLNVWLTRTAYGSGEAPRGYERANEPIRYGETLGQHRNQEEGTVSVSDKIVIARRFHFIALLFRFLLP